MVVIIFSPRIPVIISGTIANTDNLKRAAISHKDYVSTSTKPSVQAYHNIEGYI